MKKAPAFPVGPDLCDAYVSYRDIHPVDARAMARIVFALAVATWKMAITMGLSMWPGSDGGQLKLQKCWFFSAASHCITGSAHV